MATVYHARTDGLDLAALKERWHALLTTDEADRLATLRFARDQRDYLAAHALLRLAFHEAHNTELNVPPPADRSGWSLTHTDGLVACALAADISTPIGVDAELLKSAERLETLADTFLSATELGLLPTDPDGRARRMVEIWTAKEAVLKALGEGFSGEGGFGVLAMLESTPLGMLDDWATISVRDARTGSAYSAQVRWVGSHALAVVADGNEGNPRLEGVMLR